MKQTSEEKFNIPREYLTKKNVEHIIKAWYNKSNSSVKLINWDMREGSSHMIEIRYINRK